MKKNVIILLFFITLIGKMYSQESSYTVIDKKSLGNIDNVTDFKSVDNKFYILTNDSLLVITSNGKKQQSQKVKDIGGFEITGEKILTINSYSTSTETNSIETKAKFVTSYNTGHFTCKIIGNNEVISYSSKVVYIDKNGDEIFFCYIEGIPAGIKQKDGKLYYLFNNNTATQGILKVFDIETKQATDEGVVPVAGMVGLDIDENGDFYTYSNSSMNIIKFRRE